MDNIEIFRRKDKFAFRGLTGSAAAKRYVLNSAVITTEGVFTYGLVAPDEARAWLHAGPYESTIGYAETAEAVGNFLLGEPFAVNRVTIQMKTGDEALVARLKFRAGEKRIPPHLKGVLMEDFVMARLEMGVLLCLYAGKPPIQTKP